MNAPTLAQKTADAVSLWDYLAALPASFEAQLFYALLLAGTLGMMANYVVKWLRDELQGSLFTYLFRTHVKGTLLSLTGSISLAITSIGTGIFTTDAGIFVGWSTVLWFGVTNGFAVDSIANKGQRPVWNDEQRAAKLP
jgi:uncharacterized membrane protein